MSNEQENKVIIDEFSNLGEVALTDDRFNLGNVTADIERGLVEMGRRFPSQSINVAVSTWRFSHTLNKVEVDWTVTASPTIGTDEEIIQAAFRKSLDEALSAIDRQLAALPQPKSGDEINAELQVAAQADREGVFHIDPLPKDVEAWEVFGVGI